MTGRRLGSRRPARSRSDASLIEIRTICCATPVGDAVLGVDVNADIRFASAAWLFGAQRRHGEAERAMTVRVEIANPEGASLESRALLAACRGALGPALRALPLNRHSLRLSFVVDRIGRMRPRPSGIRCERVRFDGFDAEIVRPANRYRPLQDGAVLYLHGGAFMIGGLETHRPVVAGIAKRTGLAVLSVAYRQYPRTRVDGSVEDCLTAYRWLLRQGVDPGRIVVMGDSAGGFLTFATALRAARRGLPMPAGLVGISPLLDLDVSSVLMHRGPVRDAYLPERSLTGVSRLWTHGPADPALSPMNCDLSPLPATLLIVAEDEVLRSDAEKFAHRLDRVGVPCRLQLWRGQVHAFPALAPAMPESCEALSTIAGFVSTRIARRPVVARIA